MERQARPVKVILQIKKKNITHKKNMTFTVLQIGEMPIPPAYTLARGGCTFWEGTKTCRVAPDNEVVLAAEGDPKGPSTLFRLRMRLYLPLNFPWTTTYSEAVGQSSLWVAAETWLWEQIEQTTYIHIKGNEGNLLGKENLAAFLAKTIPLWVFQNLHTHKKKQ